MDTFESRPATIQAFRLVDLNEHPEAIDDLPHGVMPWPTDGRGGARIVTIQGQSVYVRPGEWIATEAKPGYYYPIAHDVFERRWRKSSITPEGRDAARVRFFTASEHEDVVALRDVIVELGAQIEARVPAGRNKALALTALEDVQMRGNRALFAPEGLR